MMRTAGRAGALPTGSDILKSWLVSYSCHKGSTKRSVLFENATHVVLKHNAHAEYCDRVVGSKNCPAYAALYAKETLINPNSRAMLYGEGYERRWEGRISKKYILNSCKELGVFFTDQGEHHV